MNDSTHTTPAFQFAPMPHMHFGWGVRQELIQSLSQRQYKKIVLITGVTVSQQGYFGRELITALDKVCSLQHFTVSGEPSPDLVDHIVSQCEATADVVLGLGGGSVLDAAKAIAGLIPSQTSVMEYLEGVGDGKPFHVKTCPFIAIPTTAGTGSETTKNAVLSRLGEFKKSFRDNKLLAQEAWLDPELLKSCSKETLYATGMDAFTQLLESYTTLKPNPMTDALAWKGMTLFKHAFVDIDSHDPVRQQSGYERLMLAASLSGTTLANAGLGAVHGLAGPIGAFFDAPHGLVCARLLAPITAQNIASLEKEHSVHARQTLEKYRDVATLLSDSDSTSTDNLAIVHLLQQLTDQYANKGLSQFGLSMDNIKPVLDNCRSGSMLGNSVVLSDQQLADSIKQSL